MHVREIEPRFSLSGRDARGPAQRHLDHDVSRQLRGRLAIRSRASSATRFRAVFFCEGGIIHCEHPPTVDPLNYLPHLKIPTIMLVTKRWLPFPFKNSQKLLFDRIQLRDPEEKELLHFPNYSYGFPPEHIDRDVNWFLNQHLPMSSAKP